MSEQGNPLIKPKRPSKLDYYLGLAKAASERATCYRARFGAIIVRDDQIIATGYVGAPRGTRDCLERESCLRQQLNIPRGQRYELCRSVHAEMNAIINAARAGVSVLNGNLFLIGYDPQTDQALDAMPCNMCKRHLINAGLRLIHCRQKDNSILTFSIADWAKEWSEGDIIDDKQRYGAGVAPKAE